MFAHIQTAGTYTEQRATLSETWTIEALDTLATGHEPSPYPVLHTSDRCDSIIQTLRLPCSRKGKATGHNIGVSVLFRLRKTSNLYLERFSTHRLVDATQVGRVPAFPENVIQGNPIHHCWQELGDTCKYMYIGES